MKYGTSKEYGDGVYGELAEIYSADIIPTTLSPSDETSSSPTYTDESAAPLIIPLLYAKNANVDAPFGADYNAGNIGYASVAFDRGDYVQLDWQFVSGTAQEVKLFLCSGADWQNSYMFSILGSSWNWLLLDKEVAGTGSSLVIQPFTMDTNKHTLQVSFSDSNIIVNVDGVLAYTYAEPIILYTTFQKIGLRNQGADLAIVDNVIIGAGAYVSNSIFVKAE